MQLKRRYFTFKVFFGVTFILAVSVAFSLIAPNNGMKEGRTLPTVIGAVRLSDVDEKTLEGFEQGLKKMGWNIGEDVVIRDLGPAGEIDKLDAMIADHMAVGVDMFFVSSTPGTQAVKRATKNSDIPVVFSPVNDPVQSNIVESLEHPGGNITGIKLPLGDDVRFQWLLQLAPGVTPVFVPYTKADNSSLQSLSAVRIAASNMRVELIEHAVKSTDDARAAAAAMPAHVKGVYIPRDSGVEAAIGSYVEEALRRRVPISAPSYTQVEAGALFSFGYIHNELGGQGAIIADKILRGAHPSSVPVEVGRSYLTINLNTAKAIGLPIPDRVIRQAARIIR